MSLHQQLFIQIVEQNKNNLLLFFSLHRILFLIKLNFEINRKIIRTQNEMNKF